MKRTATTMIAVLVVAALSLIWSPAATAQALTSGPAAITLNVSVAETLTLSCTPPTVSFSGSGGTLQASAPISCTTTWSLAPTRSSLTVAQYFTTPFVFNGLSLGPNIFTSSVDGGAATPFSNNSNTIAGVTGYFGPNLLSLSTSNGNLPSQSQHTDTSQLTLNTASMPPGSYTSTLNILAIAQ